MANGHSPKRIVEPPTDAELFESIADVKSDLAEALRRLHETIDTTDTLRRDYALLLASVPRNQ